MSKVLGLQSIFFLISVLWGAILLVMYDILRIFRRIKKHKWFTIAAEDFLFWLLAAFLIFRLMYEQNDGIIRGFSILGMGIGMILYNLSISRYFVEGVSKFFLFIGKQIHKFIHLLSKPFGFIGRFIKHRLLALKRGMGKSGKRIVKPLKKIKNRDTLKEQTRD